MYSLIPITFPINLFKNVTPGSPPLHTSQIYGDYSHQYQQYKNILLFYLEEKENIYFSWVHFTHQLPLVCIFLLNSKISWNISLYLKSLILLNSSSLKLTETCFCPPSFIKNLQESYNVLDNIPCWEYPKVNQIQDLLLRSFYCKIVMTFPRVINN